MTTRDIILANLKADLETLTNRLNEATDKGAVRSGLARIKAVRAEIAEVAGR